MYWINIKGKFVTDNPDLFIHNLKLLLQQTKTTFSGEMTQQIIKDIPCELISKEVIKETTDEKTDEQT